MNLISGIIATLIQCVIGWLFIEKIPAWLNIKGFFATLLKIIGVLIILRALLSWVF
ncbi:MAG: hypothetical protein J1E63_03640 [Muribaculaceae bacterium]|nr:hypothetical protein [Muribaculaceae bacterium]